MPCSALPCLYRAEEEAAIRAEAAAGEGAPGAPRARRLWALCCAFGQGGGGEPPPLRARGGCGSAAARPPARPPPPGAVEAFLAASAPEARNEPHYPARQALHDAAPASAHCLCSHHGSQ
jgi:hypothetical protein